MRVEAGIVHDRRSIGKGCGAASDGIMGQAEEFLRHRRTGVVACRRQKGTDPQLALRETERKREAPAREGEATGFLPS